GLALSALLELRVRPCNPGSQPVVLGDDANVMVQLGGPTHCGVSSVPFVGTTYNALFVNSNGSVSFNSGDDDYTATTSEFLNGPPRLAGLWTDLNPSAGGSVTVSSTPQGVLTVAFSNVPNYGSNNQNSF